MSTIAIKKQLRQYLRNSSLEISHKMICPMVRLIKMQNSNIDSKKVAYLASEVIKERY